MATRSDYRADLEDKLVGLTDSGFGDFDYTDSELNTFLELSAARLFPAAYKRVKLASESVTAYGTEDKGSVELDAGVPAERVYLVESTDERNALRGWQVRPGEIVAIPMCADVATVNIYYYTACSFPSDDVTAVEFPDEFRPLLVIGAFIEALEARRDTGVRPAIDSNPDAQNGLIDRLTSKYMELKQELAMALPTVVA